MVHFAHKEHSESVKQGMRHEADQRKNMCEKLTQLVAQNGARLVLFKKGIDSLLERDSSTEDDGEESADDGVNRDDLRVQLQRHLVRTHCMHQLDSVVKLCGLQAMNVGHDLGELALDIASCSKEELKDKERQVLAKALPDDIRPKALEALTAASEWQKKTDVADAVDALEDLAIDLCGIKIHKVDKKREKIILKEYRTEMFDMLNVEGQPVTSVIAIAVPLLYSMTKQIMVTLPGKVLAFAVSNLQKSLGPQEEGEQAEGRSRFDVIESLHKQTVGYIQHTSRNKDSGGSEAVELEQQVEACAAEARELISKMYQECEQSRKL